MADNRPAAPRWRAAGNDTGPSGVFYAAHARGCLHLARGEHEDARRRLRDGVEIARALHDPMFETRVLIDQGLGLPGQGVRSRWR